MMTKEELDSLVNKYNEASFIENDPVQFPRRFSKLQDIETIGILLSTIAWGNRTMILHNAEKIIGEMGNSPFEYIQEGNFRYGKDCLHRTINWDDFYEICSSLKFIYQEYESLEDIFLGEEGALDLSSYKNYFQNSHISSWEKGSAAKRINMFLRWMVRKDGKVDLGVWKRIQPSSLYIPLDTHVERNAREWGLLKRKTNDRKAVEELTLKLRSFCPEDPVKYDFALFGAEVEILQ